MNALLALHPCKAFGRSTSGIHARPRKRVRFCCSVKPSQLWWGLLPIPTINDIFRTIPITKLASLVKGEVLSPEKIRATTGGIVTPPTFFKTALSLENRHHHCLFMNALLVSYPHYHLLSTTSLPLNERFVGFASLQSLWAFNFGHPCPPSKKGEVLLLGQAEPTMVGIAPYPHHQ